MKVLVLLLAFRTFSLLGQPATTPAGFEAISIKPDKTMHSSSGNRFDPKRMVWTNTSLRTLIEAAYGLKEYQVIGAPGWADSEKWDIEATTESATTSDQKYQLLQTLLADRFHLRVHWDTKNVPVYRLVIARHGVKIREAGPNESDPKGSGTIVTRGRISGRQVEMSTLAYFLSTQLDRPITDGTGLGGRYAITLEWDPNYGQPPHESESAATNSSNTSIFAALQEQLGLKLEPARGPIQVIVIDGVAQPSRN